MYFDDLGKEWDNDPKKTERAVRFSTKIRQLIPENKRSKALDFGCGTGLLSFQLRDDFKEIYLCDTSEGMIEVLKNKIEKSALQNFKAFRIDLLKESLEIKVDAIYSLMTLHHIPQLDEILDVLISMLNSKGYICIADLVEEDGSFHDHHDDFDGHNGFNKDELSTLFLEKGLELSSYEIVYDVEKEVNGVLRKYPLFLMICQKTT